MSVELSAAQRYRFELVMRECESVKDELVNRAKSGANFSETAVGTAFEEFVTRVLPNRHTSAPKSIARRVPRVASRDHYGWERYLDLAGRPMRGALRYDMQKRAAARAIDERRHPEPPIIPIEDERGNLVPDSHQAAVSVGDDGCFGTLMRGPRQQLEDVQRVHRKLAEVLDSAPLRRGLEGRKLMATFGLTRAEAARKLGISDTNLGKNMSQADATILEAVRANPSLLE